MKYWISISLLLTLLLVGCSNSSTSLEGEKDSQRALELVRAACTEDIDWDLRAKLTAQANFLDGRWERIADAANYQSAWSQITEVIQKPNNLKQYGDQTVDFYYQVQLNLSKFFSECSIAEEGVDNE